MNYIIFLDFIIIIKTVFVDSYRLPVYLLSLRKKRKFLYKQKYIKYHSNLLIVLVRVL